MHLCRECLRCHVPDKFPSLTGVNNRVLASILVTRPMADKASRYIFISVIYWYLQIIRINRTYRIVGGSKATFVNWLNGAKLSCPSTDVVLIQPIGLGMTMLLKGSYGRPCDDFPGS
jgi:hypothetical protein